MFCKNCGNQIDDNAVICVHCGCAVAKVNTAPNYAATANAANDGKGLSVAALVLGIISVALCWLWYIALPCSIVGLVLGIIGSKKSAQVYQKASGVAVAGLILSIVGLAATVIAFIAMITMVIALLS